MRIVYIFVFWKALQWLFSNCRPAIH